MGPGGLQDSVEILGELIKLFVRAVSQTKDAVMQLLERAQVLRILAGPVVEGLHRVRRIAITVGCHEKDGGNPAGKVEKAPLNDCSQIASWGGVAGGYLIFKIG